MNLGGFVNFLVGGYVSIARFSSICILFNIVFAESFRNLRLIITYGAFSGFLSPALDFKAMQVRYHINEVLKMY